MEILSTCCEASPKNTDCQCASTDNMGFVPLNQETCVDNVCCGPKINYKSSPFELPGYKLSHFVDGFIQTPVGFIPRVKNKLNILDQVGRLLVRLGVQRNSYCVSPGLYAHGEPDSASPVMVTANYKLTFDMLRHGLSMIDAWILVLDTQGVNVWCAAGKRSFSTQELVNQIAKTQLDKVVAHRTLILPQLGATGVSAIEVKKKSGFKVIWGPCRISDIPKFMENDMKTNVQMRQVTFGFYDRMVLVPVEISLLFKSSLWFLLAMFIISGVGDGIFSLHAVWERGIRLAYVYLASIITGAGITPLLLPWIPNRAFAVKGVIVSTIASPFVLYPLWSFFSGVEILALFVFYSVVSSYLAMNFTGSTPFTSPSGVEKEMRNAMPIQILGMIIAIVCWIGAGL